MFLSLKYTFTQKLWKTVDFPKEKHLCYMLTHTEEVAFSKHMVGGEYHDDEYKNV